MSKFTRTHKSAVATFGLCVVLVSGCSSSGTRGNPSTKRATGGATHPAAYNLLPASIRSSGKIRVASSIGFPPYELYGADGKTFEGLDIDLAHALGPQLGVSVDIIDTRFPNIPSALASKRVDIVLSAFGVQPARLKTISFVTYIQDASGTMLVRADDNRVKANDPTSLCGLKLAAVAGEAPDIPYIAAANKKCRQMGKHELTVKTFSKTTDALLAVQSGQADARSSRSLPARYIAAHSKGKLKIIDNVLGEPPTPIGVGVPKGDSQLLAALQSALRALKSDGSYQKLLDKWGAEPINALPDYSIVTK